MRCMAALVKVIEWSVVKVMAASSCAMWFAPLGMPFWNVRSSIPRRTQGVNDSPLNYLLGNPQ